jgi:type I restriction enzyme, S subunit
MSNSASKRINNVPLRDVIIEFKPGFAAGQRDSSGTIQVRMNNVDVEGNLDLDGVIRVPATKKQIADCSLHPGDILFNNTNSVELVGKSALFPGHGEPVTFSNHFTRLRVDPKRLEARYLARWLTRQQQMRVFEGLCTRWVGQSAVRAEKLLGLEIPLPPLPEQKRIADILDKADAIRRKRQEAVSIASKTTSCLFYQEFGDPLFNPKEWDVVELDTVSHKITDGVHFKPTYTDEGIPFVSVKDITTGHLKFDDAKYVSEEAHAEYIKRCHPERGDVLLTKVGATYGRPALVDTDRPFSIYVSVALIKPDRTKITPIFLKEVLASDELKRQADRAIKGAGVPDLHLFEIRKFKVPLPPLSVQEDFVAKSRAIHAVEEKLRSATEQHNELFNSLVQRAFKGEL